MSELTGAWAEVKDHGIEYQCPYTGLPLVPQGGYLATVDRCRRYKVVNEIPQFLRYGNQETDDVVVQLSRLNDIARSDGWRKAIEIVYGEWPYVTDEARLGGVKVMALVPEDVVLEVGPGLGQMTGALAANARQLAALEVVPGQAEFALCRARQEGYSNVDVASGGDDCILPYADGTFSLVVLNLVLEWCGSRNVAVSHVESQMTLIREAARVLSRQGRLFVSTKNRFALRLLLGKRDEHVYEMRFGNSLPRWLMKAMLWLRRRCRPRGYLHSYSGLLEMLRGAGFGCVDGFWAVPEMRYPHEFVPVETVEVKNARRRRGFVQGEFKSTRVIMPMIPANLVRHVTPGLTFIARKQELGLCNATRQ